MPEWLIFIIMAVLIFGALGLMVGWGKFQEWRERRRAVSYSQDSGGDIMSRGASAPLANMASSLQTDNRQTADRPTMPVPTTEEMLNIFRVLRAAGVKRDALRGPWRAARLPLDNNLWTQAAPPEPPTVTPIAGRPTAAQFQDDPELTYEAPPR